MIFAICHCDWVDVVDLKSEEEDCKQGNYMKMTDEELTHINDQKYELLVNKQNDQDLLASREKKLTALGRG